MEMFFLSTYNDKEKGGALHLFLFLLSILKAREPNESSYTNRSPAASLTTSLLLRPTHGVGGRAPLGTLSQPFLRVLRVCTDLYRYISVVYTHKIITHMLFFIFFHPVCHGALFRHVHINNLFLFIGYIEFDSPGQL